MIEIDTSEDKWQKKMAHAMKMKVQFKVVTSDEKLANALQKGKFNAGMLKLILFGGGAAGAGVAVAGLTGAGKIVGALFIMGMADPEPISKAVLLIVSTSAAVLGCGFIYGLIRKLQKKKYIFNIRKNQCSDKKWVFEAKPV
jgi:hypothetical protein